MTTPSSPVPTSASPTGVGSADPSNPSAPGTRLEHDLLGDREVPAAAYYGIQTLRAQENFHITGVPHSHFPKLIIALAQVKRAAARANRQLGALDDTRAEAFMGDTSPACQDRRWSTRSRYWRDC